MSPYSFFMQPSVTYRRTLRRRGTQRVCATRTKITLITRQIHGRSIASRLQPWPDAATPYPCIRIEKKSAILDFLFLTPALHTIRPSSFMKLSFDFYIVISPLLSSVCRYGLPPTPLPAPYRTDVAVAREDDDDDGEKTFNWGEKRENWKNYSDKGTAARRTGASGEWSERRGGAAASVWRRLSIFTPEWRPTPTPYPHRTVPRWGGTAEGRKRERARGGGSGAERPRGGRRLLFLLKNGNND